MQTTEVIRSQREELVRPVLPNMEVYFSDSYPRGRRCSREYFFSVLSTLHPEYTDQLLMKSKQLRNALDEDGENNEAIELCPEWSELLKKFPQAANKYLAFLVNYVSRIASG